MAQPSGGGGPPRRGVPVERVRDEHPPGDEWRADALAGSRHSRLIDELRLPSEDHDPERAERLCAAVARNTLRDFAPALILLPVELRRRAQALAAYSLTLFDFAAQTGLEGERLSQMNRWEFELERALDGDPPGQPVFVQMSRLETEAPWPREALDDIAAAARRRGTAARARSEPELAGTSAALARAITTALGGAAGEDLVPLAALLLRTRGLQDLSEGLRRGRPSLPAAELPRAPGSSDFESSAVGTAVRAETERLRAELGKVRRGNRSLPRPYRGAARYLTAAAATLLATAARRGAGIVETPPTVGGLRRIAYLVRAAVLP